MKLAQRSDSGKGVVRTAELDVVERDSGGPVRRVRVPDSGREPFLGRWFTEAGLRTQGFKGFVPVSALRQSGLDGVPSAPGVYAVLRSLDAAPAFRSTNAGGWFKGKDPSVPVSILEEKWVAGAHLLYVGKATAGRRGGSGLRKRLALLLNYGAGKPVAHQGGRYLWQVEGANDFLVAWLLIEDPTAEENRLLSEFRDAYGAYPLANIAGPRG